eukprot:CAMPEP_0113443832 /NCGR_PEP_ID=MMETSP0014_2-20120614/2353_1 /TAXON_ID=2857 /ORGANISM="Nitzschia sp." /LENGTH=785 /DNA_ID=CAMNT_0000334823 /DNA_START=29 /DNA_END=2386 /DNA_ORIENTATION=+ /assembly_acc=CAM_ASM_000159
MTTTSAEDALAKAKLIAAQLTGTIDSSSTASTSAAVSTGTVNTTPIPAAASDAASAISNTITTTKPKRKRWGVASTPSLAVTSSALPGLAEAVEKKQKLEKAEPTSKRIWVPTSATRSETHFKSYLSDRLPDLVIRLNRENGTPGDQKNSLVLGGRGAATKFVPGMPLEPMHVMISGSPAFIALASPQLDELLDESEKAPLEGPPPDLSASSKVINGEEANGTSAGGDGNDRYVDPYAGALTTVTKRFNGTVESTASYRPATVAQLISGSTGPTFSADDGPLIEEIINVPNGLVGFIIGKGGETITMLQARTGSKVQIQKEQDLQPGQTHRVITLQATKQEPIDRVRGMIEKMVEERLRTAGGGKSGGGGSGPTSGHYGPGGGGGKSNEAGKAGLGFAPADNSLEAKVQEALAEGHKLVVAEVPDADVGMIIGKGGVTIKGIQESTNSKVHIPPTGSNKEDPTVRKISITSPTQEGAEAAKVQIDRIMANKKPSSTPATTAFTPNVPQLTVEVMIPDKDVGMCIGKGGCVINEMQRRTGTKVNIPSHPVPGQPYRVATVTGSQEGCNHVQAMVQQIVADQSSASVMSGAPHNINNINMQGGYNRNFGGGYQQRNAFPPHNQGRHQQQQQQQQLQQQQQQQSSDPAWAAYYAAVAQQQAKQQQAAAVAATAPAPSPHNTDASKYEDYFRYEYYYGTEAARQYYGTYPAYCPPPDMPNPYGKNPNGTTPAPAQSAQPSPAAPGAGARTAVDSSMANVGMGRGRGRGRGISNLPAWLVEKQRKEAESL